MYGPAVSWWCRFAALFLVVGAVLCPLRASAATGVQLETRVRGIELVVHALVGGSSARSPEKHRGSSPAYDEIAPGYSLAAEGASTLAGDSYEILDGVRRAKAAAELGQETIPAVVQVGGKTVATGQVPVSSLLSPTKSVIDVSTPSALQRWLSVLKGTQAGDALPPIVIQPGARGVPIPGVGFQF